MPGTATKKKSKKPATKISSPGKTLRQSSAADELVPDDRFEWVPLEAIVESKTNPRRTFKKLDELAASIKSHRVIKPILLRPAPDAVQSKKIKYELVAGARRLRASGMADKLTIPSIIRNLTDDEAMEIQLIENNQREDPDLLDEALGFKNYLDRGHTVPDLAAKIGRDETYIYRRLKLMDMIEPFQEMLAEGIIQYAHAVELSRLPVEFQQQIREEVLNPDYMIDGVMTAKDLHEYIKRDMELDLAQAAFPKDDPELVAECGACTACQKRTGFNPSLFPEIKKKDICLDKTCFQEKKAKFVHLQISRAQLNDGVEVVKISKDEYYSSGKTLGTNDYEIVSKKDAEKAPAKKLRTAVIVDGVGAGKTVQVKVKVDLDKKKNALEAPRTNHAEDDRKRKLKAEEQSRIRMAVARAIIGKVSGPATIDVLRVKAREDMTDYWAETAAEILGWEKPAKAGHNWWRGVAEKMIPTLNEQELHRVFVASAIGHDAHCGEYDDTKFPTDLKKMAEQYGVDVEAVKKELKAGKKSTPVQEANVEAAAEADGGSEEILKSKNATVTALIRESDGDFSGSLAVTFGKDDTWNGTIENGQIYPSLEKIKIAAADVAEKWFMNLLDKRPLKRKQLADARNAVRAYVKKIQEEEAVDADTEDEEAFSE